MLLLAATVVYWFIVIFQKNKKLPRCCYMSQKIPIWQKTKNMKVFLWSLDQFNQLVKLNKHQSTAVSHVRAAAAAMTGLMMRQTGIWKKGKTVAVEEEKTSALGEGEQKRTRLMFELLFKHGLGHCRFIIKAPCFITELGHYSRALCTIFSKPIRARWRASAHPRKDGIFTFQCRARWILIWLLRFKAAASRSVSRQLPNGFVNVLRDFCHYPWPGQLWPGRCDESHHWSLFSVAEPLPRPLPRTIDQGRDKIKETRVS